ncbi:hypothetical protein C1Y08_23885 [Pseudomonas sp. FW306-02-F02-AA]|nr:hypothetical protein C1Y07_27770 [Pseudomonas sp. FW306-02-F02-AB]PMZ06768.1 hypothetical protein C1Y06_28210 [Pseudomonas sp. FW306-02-H06C]PMZ13464.1 hypothetical protein C1Y08_23885 [Pseudomonas sp. FW306-02-F02-AA]PMZ18561.1 hypothetical protein C1Y09_28540 [Pseudomonas sp. FW306-02-F08-AA]PMZ24487.1 hypothetical protein C1Y05_28445 [Pseudomonas sp. FW306-02-F04-BA]PMZ31063.1 hypothetical protein C1X99_28205 [Pseudomonas sp. FW306-02-H06B]PMZ37143.1 hypothetical protein C1Y00_28270 [Ps
MLNSIVWIEHLASSERTPVESARKPYVPSICRKAAQFTTYKPESKGKSAKLKHGRRLYAARTPATFRPMDDIRCI